MKALSKALFVVVGVAAAFAVPAAVFATDSGPEIHASAAKRGNLYLSRASFSNASRQGVIESISRINASSPTIHLLISLHGLDPNVEYEVVASRKLCRRAHDPAVDEIFSVTLPATPGSDRFYSDSISGAGTNKHTKSARLFEAGTQTHCIPTKLYTAARYP